MRLTKPITGPGTEGDSSLAAGTWQATARADPASEMSENVRGTADIVDKLLQREEGTTPVAELQCTVAGVATGRVSEPD